MKYLITLLALTSMFGCASTIHDYCMNHLDHYKDYDECYAERAERQHRLSHAFDGLAGNNTHSTTCIQNGNFINCH